MKNIYLLNILILILFAGCFAQNQVDVNLGRNTSTNKSLNYTITNVQVINNQVVLSGTNLTSVSNVKIKDGGVETTLSIESRNNSTIIANSISNIAISAGKVLEFILSNAQAASSFTVNFSLCDSLLGGKRINCSITPQDKEVLSFDAVSNKWKPRPVNGLSYKGAWDATDPFPTTTDNGDYFLVSVASGSYHVGDWIVYNGSSFDHIANSTAMINVFGRTGAILAQEGDYNLNLLSDVDLTVAPTSGQVLKYDGTKWIAGTVSSGGSGTVTSVSGTAPISISNGTTTPSISISQSSSSTSGYLSSSDWTTFNGKQANIASGTTAQYYRGDKTWATLNTTIVPEGTNLYFTNTRAIGASISSPTLTNTAIIGGDSVDNAFGKLQAQINNISSGGSSTYLVKNSTDTITGQVTVHSGTGSLLIPHTPSDAELTAAANVQYVKNYADLKLPLAGGTLTGDLILNTQTKFKGASNYVTLKASPSLATDLVLTLPTTNGTSGQVLTTNGSGVLSWTTVSSGGGAVNTVAGRNGDVVLTTADVSEGSNLYHTTARVLGTQITSPTLTNSTIATSDTIQVALGKLQAQLNNILSLTLDSLSTATNSAITASDSILSAFGKLQAQITALSTSNGNKLSKNSADTLSGTITVSGGDIIVPTSPGSSTSVVNKTYVDNLVATGANQWTSSSSDVYRSSGNVGIGTSSLTAKLTVQGAAVSKTNIISTGAAVDLALSNNHLVKSPGGTAIILSNAVDGGAYTLIVSDTTSRTYTFSGCTNSYFSPANGATSGQTSYSILVVVDGANTNCYITWITGFN